MSSTVRVVHIVDLQRFAENMLELRTDWIQMRQALHLAMLHTVDRPIKKRIPWSTRQRYKYRVDAGNQTLFKSYHIKITKNRGTEIKIFLGSEGVEYARYVNAMPDPSRTDAGSTGPARGAATTSSSYRSSSMGMRSPRTFARK